MVSASTLTTESEQREFIETVNTALQSGKEISKNDIDKLGLVTIRNSESEHTPDAIKTLVKIGTGEAAYQLNRVVVCKTKSKHAPLAISALEEVGTNKAVQMLGDIANHTLHYPQVIRSLQNIGTDKAIQTLGWILKNSSDKEKTKRIIATLQAINTDASATELVKYEEHKNGKAAALRKAGELRAEFQSNASHKPSTANLPKLTETTFSLAKGMTAANSLISVSRDERRARRAVLEAEANDNNSLLISGLRKQLLPLFDGAVNFAAKEKLREKASKHALKAQNAEHYATFETVEPNDTQELQVA